MAVPLSEARRVGDALSVDWGVVSPETFRYALGVELEHKDVTHGDLGATGRIALAHLREYPDYYARLAPMERAAEEYWSHRKKPSPTLGGGPSSPRVAFALVLVALIAVLAYFGWRERQRSPSIGALGRGTPAPGCPDRDALRRSQPHPPGRHPQGGARGLYCQSGPAYPDGSYYSWSAPEPLHPAPEGCC